MGSVATKVGRPPRPAAERFWEKVDRSGDCWLWLSRIQHDGYGQFHQGKSLLAHRFAWELAFGPVPLGMWVLHRCDNRRCVRPEHLFLGTHSTNMRDMVRKGRQAKGLRHGRHTHPERTARGDRQGLRLHSESRLYGEQHQHAQLTRDLVALLVQSRAEGVSQREVGRRLGVSKTTVRNVEQGKTSWLRKSESGDM